ncbi:MAG TPA: DPP IV N-terminal domain-containing protein [Terracidiphilus sp.]|nr:DPP IV N-terminal domain-containing protein [Terracidiphilus sp.]
MRTFLQVFDSARIVAGCSTLLLTAPLLVAQVTPADYDRALDLQAKYRNLAVHLPSSPQWIEGTHRFVYSRTVAAPAESGANHDGEAAHEYVLFDADTRESRLAFDHARLADALSKTLDVPVKPLYLPLARLHFASDQKSMEFLFHDARWQCDLTSYVCAKKTDLSPDDDDFEGDEYDFTPKAINSEAKAKVSPDGKWKAYVQNYNLVIRPVPQNADAKPAQHEAPMVLSQDGSEDNYYAIGTLEWSPDSRHIAIYRIRPGYRRLIYYVESSPPDQLQPEHSTMVYPKPGDVLALEQPVLFDIAARSEIQIDNSLFPNPYELSSIEWWKDSRAFTFEYNQRGHQVYRVIEVDATTGKARGLIEETSSTFINYEPLVSTQYDTGKRFRKDLDDGNEIIWASERDGWEHLYLYDGRTGQVKQQITHGEWVVRGVDRVDEKAREIYFSASGRNPGEDPYFVHGYKISFDGTGLTELTSVAANHSLSYSEDGQYYVDTYSRIDLAPVMELHRASDASLVATVETADITQLRAAGWQPPEVFHTAGRDGKTQIWGVIYRPLNFDPSKKYPVIEDIYAGPQGSFVPKSFTSRTEPLTALGFVVVQIDGMGTNNRSRAFHDVAWHNLKDAGFPDRILWHQAVAAKYPWYDISRVGIFGTSAGGQSSMGALLFHPEFYKVAVSNSGCHDNRMDKIWWNEQWMGWPVGPQYSESSNVDNAWRLKGKLLLVMGEMDKNVDPSSTLQVVDRLIKANKDFDLLVVPGGGHGAGGRYGQRKLMDFFVRNLLNEPTPAWNAIEEKHAGAAAAEGQ